MKAPTTRLSLDYLRGLGYTVEVVERWVPAAAGGRQIKRDMFGILDLVALRGAETLGVQTTTKANISAHARKIAESEHVAALREAGWSLVIHGWSQPGGKGTRWHLDEMDVT